MRLSLRAAAIAAVVVLVVAVPLCLGLTERRPVDPETLLTNVLRVQRQSRLANVDCTFTIYGRQAERSCSVDWHSDPELLPRNEIERLIRSNYTPLVEGEDTIAGREAWTLRLKPALKEYPWKQLWVDKRSFVVLAQREWSAYNKLKNHCSANSTRVTGPPDVARSQPITDPGSTAAIPRPRHLPHGFVLAQAIPEDRGAALLYSDGLFLLTVQIGPAESGSKRATSVEDFGQGLIASGVFGGRSVTVVGDLSEEEIVRVLRSVR